MRWGQHHRVVPATFTHTSEFLEPTMRLHVVAIYHEHKIGAQACFSSTEGIDEPLRRAWGYIQHEERDR